LTERYYFMARASATYPQIRRRGETTVTVKGQVTIPVEVRRALGVKPHDRVRFVLDPSTGVVTVERASSVVDELFGVFADAARNVGTPWTREDFEQAVADDVMSETA
jgi:AbrB family looped-hinge helix DNA binding protein